MTSDPNSAAARRPAPELSPAERKALRAQAHHLDPVVAVGDAGLTPGVLAETDRALSAHGLIKIRVHGDDRERRLAILDEICASLGCAPVQTIGKLLVVWREKPETGTGGDAGTARRRAGRQTKKAAGSGQKASAAKRKPAAKAPSRARPATAGASPARKAPGTGPARKAAGTSPARKAPAAKPGGTGARKPAAKAATGGARKPAAAGLTRSARPGSGTRARRRAP